MWFFSYQGQLSSHFNSITLHSSIKVDICKYSIEAISLKLQVSDGYQDLVQCGCTMEHQLALEDFKTTTWKTEQSDQ